MASSKPLADIEERFFHCSFCLEPFKDPKLLPCLHRYCRGCLGTIIAEKQDSFKCPLCQEDCKIPEGRADGFKTDFHIKSVVEFLLLQASFDQGEARKCHGCKKTQTLSAYCFKCNNFLCDQCYQLHLNNEIVSEHRPHVLNLQNVDLRSLTLDKLASLTEHPRCTKHSKNLTDLSCVTCDNLPICVVCIYGKHRGHDIRDIQELAQLEREKLNVVLSELDKYKFGLYELPKRVEKVRAGLMAHVKEKVEVARAEYRRVYEEITSKVEENKVVLEKRRKEIQDRKENDCNQVKQECEIEMEKVRQRYNDILKDKEEKYDRETKQIEDKYGGINYHFSTETERLRKTLAKYEEELVTKRTQNEEKCQAISDHSELTIKKYETFTATTSTILASNDEWTDAQCLPDITAASGPLLDNMKKEFPELDSLSKVKMGDLLLKVVIIVTITEEEESVVDISSNGAALKGWQVYGIDGSSDETVVISGSILDNQKSHITVINMKGEVIRQDEIEKVAWSQYHAVRYCKVLSQSLIATVCKTNQVGIYDISNGKYFKKHIRDLNITWPKWLTCVATATMNNIYVGSNGVDVLVFDDKLKYQHNLKLPQLIQYPRDMTMHYNHLLVCGNQRACAVTVEGLVATLVFEFPKPNNDGSGWHPISVCTDSKSFPYILWNSGSGHRVVAQYSRNGEEIITTRKVDKNAQCVTTLETSDGEKLLIVTRIKPKLYTYGLNP